MADEDLVAVNDAAGVDVDVAVVEAVEDSRFVGYKGQWRFFARR